MKTDGNTQSATTTGGVAPNENPLLAGVRILDLSRLLPGPFCTLYLAQMGADVVKVEEPAGGDYLRADFPELFELVNRGKKSVTLDLRLSKHRAEFLRLAADSDVVLESFRPGVMDRLGCGYEVVSAVNPRIVYASLSGYGQTGPYRTRPGHDLNYRGYAGELDQTGERDGRPASGNFAVADLAGGALTCAVAILGALLGVKVNGVGTYIDAAMLDGTLALQVVSLATLRRTGRAPQRGCDRLSGVFPNYDVYECADGRHLAVGAVEPKFFREVLRATGTEVPPGADLRMAMSALFKTRTRDDWERDLASLETCVSAVLAPDEALENEQVKARGIVERRNGGPAFRFPAQFSHARTHSGSAPRLGADNQQLLIETPTSMETKA